MVNQGLQTGAVALPLGNYHNIGENSLKPEQIAVSDALHLVDLFVYLVQRKGGALGALKQGRETLKLSLDKRFKSYLPLLEKTIL